MTRRVLAATVLAAATLTLAAPAFAHTKAAVCHPVEGKGQTGTGWDIISPDKASSHIDEATGAGRHTRSDGRTDVYAVNGLCPGQTPTPTTIPTTVTPSPTTTGGTPSATTTTSVPSSSTTATQSPSPSTSATTGSPTPSTSQSSPTSKPATPTLSSPKPRQTAPQPATTVSKPSPASPRRSVPSTTAARPELAFTGARSALAALGVVLLGAAGVAYGARRRIGAHR